MAAIPVAYLIAASAAMTVVSAIQQGNVASANAKSAANVAGYNAKVAENNAVAARQQAGANEEAFRRQAAIDLGKQRASIAENGSGLDSYASSLANVELDAQNIRYGGELKALGMEQESVLQRNSAAISRGNASSAMTGGILNAGAAALSGVSSYGKYNASLKLPVGQQPVS